MNPHGRQHRTCIDGRRALRLALGGLALAVLAACGGGGDAYDGGGFGVCSTDAKKQWLHSYFKGVGLNPPNYFWYASSPNPDPANYVDEVDYFEALRFAGTGATTNPNDFFPRDKWSYSQSTASFNQFFGDGQTMGYGFSVAGLEVVGRRTAPLYVRIVDPSSPAAAAGLQRGDEVVSISEGGNTFTAAQLIDQITLDQDSGGHFTILSPANPGSAVDVVVRRGGVLQASKRLVAGTYAITPVDGVSVVTTTQGRRMGYIFVRTMISQAHAGFDDAFDYFKRQGVTELVIDLRYNGGGLVETGRRLASYTGGQPDSGKAYAKLLWNDQLQAKNSSYLFQPQTNSLNLPRAYVLVGERTCSASEQVINGLRGVGIDAVLVGDTTCGKPVGFLPSDNSCGTTYSVVNFESVNELNAGRYFDGFAPTCLVAEDFRQPIGSSLDPLFAAAQIMADGGACPTAGSRESAQALAKRAARSSHPGLDGERVGMFDR